jgi:hypothetical protein
MAASNLHMILLYANNVTWTNWATDKLDIPQLQEGNDYIV